MHNWLVGMLTEELEGLYQKTKAIDLAHLLSAGAWMLTIAVKFPAYADSVVEPCQFDNTWSALSVGQ